MAPLTQSPAMPPTARRCMPTGIPGLQAIVPFFYAIYFAVLLIHRDRRDDAACRVKYGADWDKYCSIVKSRIVPFIY